jgi:methylmalonyl-CoA mutase N-terminal domain/subunit
MERGAEEYIAKIDALGGMVAAIERGYPQREIADAAYRYQVSVDTKEKIVVGVNDYLGTEKPIDILHIDRSVAERQFERLRRLRAARSTAGVEHSLEALRKAAERTPGGAVGSNVNLMPHLYEAAKAYATLGEICSALRQVFGAYEEVAIT